MLPRIVLVLLVIRVLPRCVSAEMTGFPCSKEKVAAITTRNLVTDALPRWQREHATACPPDLTLLVPYTSSDNVADPWGHPYLLICDPLRDRAVAISSGPDEVLGTPDDILHVQ